MAAGARACVARRSFASLLCSRFLSSMSGFSLPCDHRGFYSSLPHAGIPRSFFLVFSLFLIPARSSRSFFSAYLLLLIASAVLGGVACLRRNWRGETLRARRRHCRRSSFYYLHTTPPPLLFLPFCSPVLCSLHISLTTIRTHPRSVIHCTITAISRLSFMVFLLFEYRLAFNGWF